MWQPARKGFRYSELTFWRVLAGAYARKLLLSSTLVLRLGNCFTKWERLG